MEAYLDLLLSLCVAVLAACSAYQAWCFMRWSRNLLVLRISVPLAKIFSWRVSPYACYRSRKK